MVRSFMFLFMFSMVFCGNDVLGAPKENSLSVMGLGEVKTAADAAEFSLAFEAYAFNADSLKSSFGQVMEKLFLGLNEFPENSLSIIADPLKVRTDWRKSNVTNIRKQLIIAVSDLQILNDVLKKCNDLGFYSAKRIEWKIDNEKELRERAEKLACIDAQASAERVARELGVKLSKVNNVRVESNDRSSSRHAEVVDFAGVSSSESTVSVQYVIVAVKVSVVYDIE